MDLDLTALERAIAELEDTLDLYDSQAVQDDARMKRKMVAAAIQAFEFTYEVSIKMLRRYIKAVSDNPRLASELSFNDAIRRALHLGLVQSELDAWKEYRRLRGITSHTYNKDKAQMVFGCVPDFLEDAKYLLDQLQKNTEASRNAPN